MAVTTGYVISSHHDFDYEASDNYIHVILTNKRNINKHIKLVKENLDERDKVNNPQWEITEFPNSVVWQRKTSYGSRRIIMTKMALNRYSGEGVSL